ncbi:GAF and ANTAR domain-containing protein [Nocardioides sp. CPCC 205120]|uniref:GAF and ANTAR domain-containing protein n=1 Tax=Nocardioides sp. CPCC 205120 TaxID=3406462 RepID=UPI003B5048AC
MSTDPSLPRAAEEALRQVTAPRDVPTTLQTIVEVAQRTLPGIDHVSVSLARRDGTLETVAGTDEVARGLDRVQYELGEGPCLHAVLDEHTIVVEHMRHEQRWPEYVARAVREGLQAQMGLRLFVDDDTLGGLNLYSSTQETLDEGTLELAELFAAGAAVALGGVRERTQLAEALESRELIGVAVGVVMQRFGLDRTRAFEFLARTSQNSNTKMRDVAARLIDQTEQESRMDEDRTASR